MKTENEIVRQIKVFQDEWRRYEHIVPVNQHCLYHMESIDREIEALEWVLGYHIEWDDEKKEDD
jgi:hypothetical protein